MENSTFRHEYTLRQDTPLIHFQHDQTGACLRASEVKPQLDRFIHAFLINQGSIVPKAWYASQSKVDSVKALAYKLSISCDSSSTMEPHKLYFGNMGKNDQKNMQQMYTNICARFICFTVGETCLKNGKKYSLLELIDYILPAFFELTCFGTRATKGFGSFTVMNRCNLDENYLLQFVPVYYTITYCKAPTYNEVLNDIWVISGMMKSGFNFTFREPNDYYKGRILRYFSEKGIGSDKAFIKQKVLLSGKDENKKSEEYRDYKNQFVFSRAMLGLAQQYEFRSGKKTDRRGNVKVSAAPENPVERFASPVRFIPNGDKLLILPTKIPERMYGAKFLLNEKTISTPSKDNFDLIKYLDWFCKEFNTRKEIGSFINNSVSPTIKKKLEIKRHPYVKGENGNE